MCDETLSKLLQWISEIEDKLANQDVVKEDVEDLRNQINTMKVHSRFYLPYPIPNASRVIQHFHLNLQQVKDDLEAHNRPVSSCLDQVRQVVLTGSDVLSSDEVSTLEKNGRSLKTRFDRASDRSDRLLRRLIGARDELTKFK